MIIDPKKNYEAVAMVLICIAISFISAVILYATGLTKGFTVDAHALSVIVNAMVYASCMIFLINQVRKS